ncbi:MAG: hypothetical protein NTV05_12540 [Acidobacteria bacterium]|nr:hypothetical protein [Acidobacteriota bacterium]
MTLTEVGESRVNGYLFILDRSLRSFLPREIASDAVREVASHIRERCDQAEAAPDERAAIERVLAELGPPLRVAQAYSHEMTLDEAVTTGRFVPMARALWHSATSSVVGFGWAILVFTGWSMGVSLLAMAVLKPVFPNNIGFFTLNGQPRGFGMEFALPPGTEAHGGYWLMPVALVAGLGVLVVTQRLSRRILLWMRARKPSARIALKIEVLDRSK